MKAIIKSGELRLESATQSFKIAVPESNDMPRGMPGMVAPQLGSGNPFN